MVRFVEYYPELQRIPSFHVTSRHDRSITCKPHGCGCFCFSITMDRSDGDDTTDGDSDDHDSSEEEDEYGPFVAIPNVEVDADHFEPGLRDLEACGRRAAGILSVSLTDHDGWPREDRTEDEMRPLRRGFARFVDLLDRYGRGGVRVVDFDKVQFDKPGWEFEKSDQERLFGNVLPTLPFLERVLFLRCALPIADLGRFASKLSAVTAPSLVELRIDECDGDLSACVPDIAGMIRRNVPIRHLRLFAPERMDRDACRQIFNSVQHNSNLRHLDVHIEQVYDDVRFLPNHPMSSLQRLIISVQTWTPEGKSSLANQLRTSAAALEELRIVYAQPDNALCHEPWIEPLRAHNISLCILAERNEREPHLRGTGIHHDAIAACLRRNGRIQQALDELRDYRVSPPVLWPRAWGLVSDLPSLLYRFVRLGDVSALCGLLRSRSHPSKRRDNGPGHPQKMKRSVPPAAARPRPPCSL
jgi:hypothetical protein